MDDEVRVSGRAVRARGIGYGCAAGAASALLPGLLLGAMFPTGFVILLPIALAVGVVTGGVLGLVGGLALAHYCVPGPVTVRSAKRVVATTICVFGVLIVLSITADFALRHKPISVVGVVSAMLVGPVIPGLIASALAERVVWGQAAILQRRESVVSAPRPRVPRQ